MRASKELLAVLLTLLLVPALAAQEKNAQERDEEYEPPEPDDPYES